MKRNLFVIMIIVFMNIPVFSELSNTNTVQSLPVFTALSLDGTSVTVPDQVSPKVEVVVMTFSRQDVAVTGSWITAIKEKYRDNPDAAFYQVAVIPEMPFVSGLILNGIKGAISRENWGGFLIYSGDKDRITKALDVDDASLFYVYVTGREGKIGLAVKAARPSPENLVKIEDAFDAEIKKK
jgi:hypothetical protein